MKKSPNNAETEDNEKKPAKKLSIEDDVELPSTIAGLPSHPIIKRKAWENDYFYAKSLFISYCVTDLFLLILNLNLTEKFEAWK